MLILAVMKLEGSNKVRYDGAPAACSRIPQAHRKLSRRIQGPVCIPTPSNQRSGSTQMPELHSEYPDPGGNQPSNSDGNLGPSHGSLMPRVAPPLGDCARSSCSQSELRRTKDDRVG